MVTIKDLSNIIDNNVLHELYTARDLTLADVTENDQKNLKELSEKEQKEYKELISLIKNIPTLSAELLQNIERRIENHVDNNAQISAYYDEKLYKCGVIDGIILMLESMRIKNAKDSG